MERIGIFGVILLLPFLIILLGIQLGKGEIDEHEFEDFLNPARQVVEGGTARNFLLAVLAAKNEQYLYSCSDCHLAYSPNMLPERSWKELMTTESLEDHFGEFIYLEDEEKIEIERFLYVNSAEVSKYKLSEKIVRSIRSDETPIRIREVRAILRRHDTIPEKYITGNEKVLSLSQCQNCHQQADSGVFDKDDVYIVYQKKESEATKE